MAKIKFDQLVVSIPLLELFYRIKSVEGNTVHYDTYRDDGCDEEDATTTATDLSEDGLALAILSAEGRTYNRKDMIVTSISDSDVILAELADNDLIGMHNALASADKADDEVFREVDEEVLDTLFGTKKDAWDYAQMYGSNKDPLRYYRTDGCGIDRFYNTGDAVTTILYCSSTPERFARYLNGELVIR